jgi:cytochrome oxidase assembly protein ShyY1
VFRALVWTLQQRRYRALALAGLIVAVICVGIGTFEIHRFQDKRHDNSVLRTNAHAAGVPLTTSLVPLTGRGVAPSANAIRYRHVTVRGRYVAALQQYVANKTQHGRQGFYVLTPLRMSDATLLVVRGFVAANNDETRPKDVTAPPTGDVQLAGWLQTVDTADDQNGRLGHGEIMSINPDQQVGRIGSPVFQASLTLTAHQPGTAGVALVPLPGLGNPTGGAAEWQLLSYVIQWYAFAVLALLMPFLVSRAEVRDARHRYLGIDPARAQLDAAASAPREIAAASPSNSALVARGRGEMVRRAQDAQRVERAARLADRYGRSLGIDPEAALAAAPPDTERVAPGAVVRDSSTTLHRSADEYHASYNDYLWQLALADGGLPNTLDGAEPQRIEAVSANDDDSDGPVP